MCLAKKVDFFAVYVVNCRFQDILTDVKSTAKAYPSWLIFATTAP